ncbi:MAG: helix-turn-helix domain-containing protein [Gallionella sp.]|uniref:helix-turn-helix domain-containing protein n=1 Tax=Candidatus Binatus sp. TaxID=2811406 RepID=UPI003C4FEB7E
MKPQLLTNEQAAEFLGGIRPNTLEGWRLKGVGPAFYKIGRLVRYDQADLEAYLESQKRSSTSCQTI